MELPEVRKTEYHNDLAIKKRMKKGNICQTCYKEKPVKRRGVWPDPLHSSMESSTELAQPSKMVTPKSQVVMGSSNVNGTQGELGR